MNKYLAMLLTVLAGCDAQPQYREIVLHERYWQCTKTASSGAKPVVTRCVQYTEKGYEVSEGRR